MTVRIKTRLGEKTISGDPDVMLYLCNKCEEAGHYNAEKAGEEYGTQDRENAMTLYLALVKEHYFDGKDCDGVKGGDNNGC